MHKMEKCLYKRNTLALSGVTMGQRASLPTCRRAAENIAEDKWRGVAGNVLLGGQGDRPVGGSSYRKLAAVSVKIDI